MDDLMAFAPTIADYAYRLWQMIPSSTLTTGAILFYLWLISP